MPNSDSEPISQTLPNTSQVPQISPGLPVSLLVSHRCVQWAPPPGGPARWYPRPPGRRGRSRQQRPPPQACRTGAAWLWSAPPVCPPSPQTGWSGCTPQTSSWGGRKTHFTCNPIQLHSQLCLLFTAIRVLRLWLGVIMTVFLSTLQWVRKIYLCYNGPGTCHV